MKTMRAIVMIGVLAAIGAVPVIAQVHKFFTPGTVWTVTMIKIASGMDQSFLQYLDGSSRRQRRRRSRPDSRSRTRFFERWTTAAPGTS
jgi:hypothetical protein